MKTFSLLAMLLMSSQTFSAEVEKLLLPEEIRLAIRLADKYEVPMQGDVYTKTEYEVVTRVKGFNPASWTLFTGKKNHKLTSSEIQGMIAVVNRVEAPLVIVDPITTETRVVITGKGCGMSPDVWTVSFEQN